MNDFTIYIDRLSDSDEHRIDFTCSCTFLEIDEPELIFSSNVQVKGKAYLAGAELIIQLQAQTKAFMPCRICNSNIAHPIAINDFYHVQPMASITSRIFDFSSLLREEILLQVPQFTECNEGNCSERQILKPYLKETQTNISAAEGYRPFSNLDIAIKQSRDSNHHN